MNNNKECFGTIFPDLEKLGANKEVKGKVFSVKLTRTGISKSSRKINPDIEQWNRCRQCEAFDSCFSFSQGRLNLYNSLNMN